MSTTQQHTTVYNYHTAVHIIYKEEMSICVGFSADTELS